jgi:hypothetical protein
MVNYLYDIETIESNHEAFVNDETVMRSADVDALLAVDISPRTRILAEAQPRDTA